MLGPSAVSLSSWRSPLEPVTEGVCEAELSVLARVLGPLLAEPPSARLSVAVVGRLLRGWRTRRRELEDLFALAELV